MYVYTLYIMVGREWPPPKAYRFHAAYARSDPGIGGAELDQ